MENDRKRRRVDVSAEKLGSGGVQVRNGTECPYMSTINRKNLDFDFLKVCIFTLKFNIRTMEHVDHVCKPRLNFCCMFMNTDQKILDVV